jgi:putative oxidoreductase
LRIAGNIMSKAQSIGNWVVIGLLAFAFGAAGTEKLMGVEMVHHSFSVLGLPEWFGYFIGVCEILGAIGQFIKQLSSTAATGLLLIMLGAIGYHLTYDPFSAVVPALVLAGLSAYVIVARKAEAFWNADKAVAV